MYHKTRETKEDFGNDGIGNLIEKNTEGEKDSDREIYGALVPVLCRSSRFCCSSVASLACVACQLF